MHNRKPHNPVYDTKEWKRLRRHVLAEHRRIAGSWCPGLDGTGHPAHDLTVDHLVPLARGGSLLDLGNVAVLCRSCNGRKRHG